MSLRPAPLFLPQAASKGAILTFSPSSSGQLVGILTEIGDDLFKGHVLRNGFQLFDELFFLSQAACLPFSYSIAQKADTETVF